MRRQRSVTNNSGGMTLFFGARNSGSLPYFGPLTKVPKSLMTQHLVYSRDPNVPKEYVQDRLLQNSDIVGKLLNNSSPHIYICGLRDKEAGVEEALNKIVNDTGKNWKDLRDEMRADGRFHVETY
jgi:benzoyl-CoA 2,3-dioxygenase component A